MFAEFEELKEVQRGLGGRCKRGGGCMEGDETEARETGSGLSRKGFVCRAQEFGLYATATSQPLEGFK